MANPQPTDAHLRIAHSISEQIFVSMFSERQLRVLFFILRLSWGCGKHSACIPKQRDFELCGVGEGHIKPILDDLTKANVVIRDGTYYQLNKNFDQWRVSLAHGYNQQKLTELVSLNIKETDQDLRELTESVSQNLPKREETPYRIGKLSEPNSESPKESIKESINIINNNKDIQNYELTDIILDDLTLEKCLEIAEGRNGTPFTERVRVQTELRKRGILFNWPEPNKKPVPNKDDPEKYTRGKFGHMVRR